MDVSNKAVPHVLVLVAQVWVDPLTRRRFGSENTYLAHMNSNKYKELVRRSGQPAPEPVIMLRRADAQSARAA